MISQRQDKLSYDNFLETWHPSVHAKFTLLCLQDHTAKKGNLKDGDEKRLLPE